ncbi:MAG: hypothetical protein KY394_06825 [Actinobacteria bacterium]|nr:hypothetical protein [Actinomycetota bacterium]
MAIQLVTLALIFLPALGALAQEGNPGTVKVDDKPFDSETDNEPKTNCVFQIDFYGFEDQTAVVTLAAQPPTGNEQLFTTEVALTTAESGEELSGSVTVDLTDELEAFDPAQAEQFDYKVDLTVETVNPDQSADTKNGIFFLTCEAAAGDAGDEAAAAGAAGEATTPEGAAATGAGGSASSSAAVYLITGAALLGAAAILGRKTLGL